MAGYMTILQGHVYEGQHKAAVDLKNGQFAYIKADGLVAPVAEEMDTTVRVKALEGPYGLTGLRVVVEKQGTKAVYLVENLPANRDQGEELEIVTKAGEAVRMHRLLAGEEALVSLASIAGITVGDVITIGAAAGAFPAVV